MVGARACTAGRSLSPLRSGISIIWHDEIDSTNDEAHRLAEGGAADGTIVAALRQTAGKGRQGRRWTSLPGNLNASFLLRPAPAPREAPKLGFAAALAVADTLAHFLHPSLRPRLKWPNDVLLAQGKIAGILVESAGDWVVIGIGINLAGAPYDTPYPAEALATFGSPPTPAEALLSLESSLKGWLARLERDGFEAIAAAWLALGPAPDQELVIRTGAETISGRFVGLGPDGELFLETPGGTRKIASGETLNPAATAPALPKEISGPPGPEPTRYGDWQFKGRVTDF
ncbi:MAG: biotin--[acetyl-CoA-carboxylase] ligase [Acetobacteraceae bacterium]